MLCLALLCFACFAMLGFTTLHLAQPCLLDFALPVCAAPGHT
jgi:hypothetical protein